MRNVRDAVSGLLALSLLLSGCAGEPPPQPANTEASQLARRDPASPTDADADPSSWLRRRPEDSPRFEFRKLDRSRFAVVRESKQAEATALLIDSPDTASSYSFWLTAVSA